MCVCIWWFSPFECEMGDEREEVGGVVSLLVEKSFVCAHELVERYE